MNESIQMKIQIKMGDIHMLKKDWQVAILAYDTCKGKETTPKFYMNLAECYQNLDQFDSALENLDQAVDKFESKTDFSSNIGEFSRCLFTRGLIHHRKLNLKVFSNLERNQRFFQCFESDHQIGENTVFQFDFGERKMLSKTWKIRRINSRSDQSLQIQ